MVRHEMSTALEVKVSVTPGINNVTAIPLYDVGQSTDFAQATGPADLAAGKHGWVRATYTTTANSRTVRVPHALLRSAYSGNVIDLKNGVWNNGSYTGQPVKVIFLPTLNNHGSFGSEDYAGPTSALKCHLGIVEFAGSSGVSLHNVGYNTPISPQAMASFPISSLRVLKRGSFRLCACLISVLNTHSRRRSPQRI